MAQKRSSDNLIPPSEASGNKRSRLDDDAAVIPNTDDRSSEVQPHAPSMLVTSSSARQFQEAAPLSNTLLISQGVATQTSGGLQGYPGQSGQTSFWAVVQAAHCFAESGRIVPVSYDALPPLDAPRGHSDYTGYLADLVNNIIVERNSMYDAPHSNLISNVNHRSHTIRSLARHWPWPVLSDATREFMRTLCGLAQQFAPIWVTPESEHPSSQSLPRQQNANNLPIAMDDASTSEPRQVSGDTEMAVSDDDELF